MLLWLLPACMPPESRPDRKPHPTSPPVVPVPAPVPTPPVPCGLTSEPTLDRPDSEQIALVRVLELAFDEPAAVGLDIDGETAAWFEAATTHSLPVLGLRPGEPHEVAVVWTCPDGASGEAGPWPIEAPRWPDPWPDVAVTVSEPSLRQGGPTLITLRSKDQQTPGIAVLDDDGIPVWWWQSAGKIVDARMEPDGTIWAMESAEVVRIDRLGNELARWSSELDPKRTGPIVDGIGTFHHEVLPIEDGAFLALTKWPVAVDAYPLLEAFPNGPSAPAIIEDSRVVEVDASGVLVMEYSLADVLDTQRIGWGSLNSHPSGYDWAHANGIVLDPVDGDLIVSVRHQDAVVELDRATGELEWILSTPDGWVEPWASLRLQPDGVVDWPYHQHEPEPLVDGGLLVFDNGNNDRTTPYAGVTDGDPYSRMVEYVVDEQNGTVRQRWELAATSLGPLFSGAYGDHDDLDDGNRLGVWGDVQGGALLLEAAPDGTIVWEVQLTGSPGWSVQRAQRLESLYPSVP